MKKKVLITSVVTIILCLCLIAGSTFALFTSTASVNVAVTSGTVDVTATIEGLQTWSLEDNIKDYSTSRNGKFSNGGFAKIEDGKLIIDRMTPGDVVKFTIKVIDNSNVAAQFRVSGQSATAVGNDLTPALEITTSVAGTKHYFNDQGVMGTSWVTADTLGFTYDANGNKYILIDVVITFPNHDTDGSIDNQYKNCQCNVQFVVEAVQANGVDLIAP